VIFLTTERVTDTTSYASNWLLEEEWKEVHGDNTPEKQEHQWKLPCSKKQSIGLYVQNTIRKKEKSVMSNKIINNAWSKWQKTTLYVLQTKVIPRINFPWYCQWCLLDNWLTSGQHVFAMLLIQFHASNLAKSMIFPALPGSLEKSFKSLFFLLKLYRFF